MKLSKLNNIVDNLHALNNFSQQLDYNTSSRINQYLIQILPELEKELKDRTANNEAITGCPQLVVLSSTDEEFKSSNLLFEEYVNSKLREFIEKGYDIKDYGLFNIHEEYSAKNIGVVYIKYTI